MESVEERLNKLREERMAREKARIDMLRELNLKKYNKNEVQSISKAPSTNSLASRTLKMDINPKTDVKKSSLKCSAVNHVKNNFHVNGSSNRSVTAPIHPIKPLDKIKTIVKKENSDKTVVEVKNISKMVGNNTNSNKNTTQKKDFINSNKIISKSVKQSVNPVKNVNMPRKSLAPIKITNRLKLPESQTQLSEKPKETRKTMLPMPASMTKSTRNSMLPIASVIKNRESVFDRLYKPRMVQKTEMSDADRLQRDPLFLQKVLQQGSLISNKRHTIFANVVKPVTKAPVRRSISAVHLKRISKKELGNCIQKWSSIGEKLNEIHITNTNEDDQVKQDTITSAIKSERKRVRLQTPISFTPRPEELQNRLQKWLQSRGKSIDSYHHLQCFGIHHLAEKPLRPLFLRPEADYDDENKENVALENDSDNESYTENMNDDIEKTKWRGRVSYVSDSVCINDSDHDTTLNSDEAPLDDVLLGALNDLTELLREGFDWEQCARWLRALRARFPHAPSLAAYWECRAALEETRGDLPASVQCWEEAIAKGTQHSVVDANLDQLLDKFMQLKISPNNSGKPRVDPKLVDVKNVFKSTIIRFAVQQAKLRQSNQSDQPTYIMTPVRRSGRLDTRTPHQKTPHQNNPHQNNPHQKTPHQKTPHQINPHQKTPHQKTSHQNITHQNPRTPLQICSSVRQAELVGEKVLFVPNSTLCDTP